MSRSKRGFPKDEANFGGNSLQPVDSGRPCNAILGDKVMKQRIAGLFLAAGGFLLGAAQPARAIVINDVFGTAAAKTLANPFTGVGQLSVGCSGALISPTVFLTAQHCTFGTAANTMSVGFDQNNDGVFDATVSVASKIEVDATNSLLDGTDIAFLTLSAAAPVWADPFGLYAGDPTGLLATMIGYGFQGVGSTGWSGTPSARWAAENIVDRFGMPVNSAGSFAGANIISTDFDNPGGTSNTLAWLGSSAAMLTREGTTAPGDSGGPLLLMFGSSYYISGVLSGGTSSDSRYGDISWWTGVAPYRSELERLGGVFFTTPEPGVLALVSLGLLAVIRVRRRR